MNKQYRVNNLIHLLQGHTANRSKIRLFLWGIWLVILILTTTAWIQSYRASLWWPPCFQGSGLQTHAWKGRVFVIWVYDPGDPTLPPGWFAETKVYDVDRQGLEESEHPEARYGILFDIYEQNKSFSARQYYLPVPVPGIRNGFGFGFFAGRMYINQFSSFGIAGLPFWFPGFLLLLFPLSQFLRLRRIQTRIRQRICLRCGYDVRSSPDRCPECGTTVPGIVTVTS